MHKFKVVVRQPGGGIATREVEANKFTVGLSGSLEFWRVTEHGDALILAIEHGRWLQCEEPE